MAETPVAETYDGALRLNDGRAIPRLGFGTWQIGDREAPEVVTAAIRAGYRLIDTAAAYGNETGVGRAMRDAGVPRADLFLTTKVWNDSHGFDPAMRSAEASLKRLGLESLDLLLIHWPCPARGRYVETWKALLRLREEGRARSIGVSNFLEPHLERIIGETGVAPAVNQIELHPRFQQAALRAVHARHGIVTECWTPLGGDLLRDPTVAVIAKKHGRSPAQVILRWHLEAGLVAIPKTTTPARMAENRAILDFRLDGDDQAGLAGLDSPGGRTGPDPATFG
jgi:2,5-diketo-D-gluconate reductase A